MCACVYKTFSVILSLCLPNDLQQIRLSKIYDELTINQRTDMYQTHEGKLIINSKQVYYCKSISIRYARI